jgi:protein-disulfide isomerase
MLAAVALCGVLGASACGETQSSDDSTADLSQSLLTQPQDDGSSSVIAGDPAVQDDGGPRVRVAEVGFNRGVEEALVKVVEMSDYGCGYCRQFHQETFPAILAEYIETGMVEWKFVPYITGMFDNSLTATEAAECTYAQDPEAFERLNRRLWDDQRDWKGAGDPAPVVRGWVAELGIDMAAFDACVADDTRIPRIAASTTLARQIGVRGTPTFVILGYPPIQGALPLETFREVLDMVHAESEAAVAAGAQQPQ